jgi:CPA1 family monovalent cation:H+ antiporter
VPDQIFVAGMVVVVAILLGRLLAARFGIPDAAAYALLGVAAGLLPGMSQVRLSPDVVLMLFLPPLLHYAAFFSDPREARRHLAAVTGQSVGLVVATAVAVAGALMVFVPDIGWAAALAFGAAIAPPDPVAATSVLERVGVPRRLVTVLEAEGLINDGVALTLFSLAVTAVGASLSGTQIGLQLLLQVVGGIGLGVVVGVVATWLRARIRDTPSQAVLSLATPYLAFVPAHLVHASGVLATVTAAVWLGSRGRGLVAPTSRLQTETFWRLLNLLLVATLFVLLGLQVPATVRELGGYPVGSLMAMSVAVVLVAVLVRFGWAMLFAPLVSKLPWPGGSEPSLSRRERAALGWCGPRGAVCLAVALSLPLATASGAPFPRRDLFLFLTIVVVLATLVGQMVALPVVLRRLGLEPDAKERSEGVEARYAAVEASLRELDALDEAHPTAEELRQIAELRRERLRGQLAAISGDAHADDVRSDGRQLRLELLSVERRAVQDLHDNGEISRATLLDISQELDLEETRLTEAR